jgi:O-antigen/teichoic acid export membrane protein
MLKAVFSDSVIYGISNVASRAVGFILLPFYARILAPADIGVLDLIQSVGSILTFLFSLEINNAFARFSADCGSDVEKRKTLTATTWASILITNGVGLLVLAMFPLHEWLDDSKYAKLSGLMGYAIMLWAATIFIYTTQNQLRWERRAKAYGTLSFVMASVTVLLGYWQVVIIGAGVKGALFALVCGASSASLMGLFLVFKGLWARPSYSLWSKMAIYALPLLAGNLVMSITQQADRFLITGTLGLDALGEYGIATRFASILQIAITGFQMAIVPIIFAEHGNPKTPEMLRKATSAYSLICGAAIISLATLAPELVSFVASARYVQVAPLVPVLALAVVIFNAYVLFPGLWIAKRTKTIAWINALYGIVTAMLLFLGVHADALMGVALAMVASNLLYLFANYHYSQSEYPVEFDWPVIYIALSGVTICILAVATGMGLVGRMTLLTFCEFTLITLAWRRGFLSTRNFVSV